MKEAIEYVEHGFGLVELRQNTKKPVTDNWNLFNGAITTIEEAAALRNCGIGLHHVASRTCAIDIDNFSKASDWFAEHGINLAGLMMQDEAVQISSGREGRAKLIYKIPDREPLLATQSISDEDGMILELRCAYISGVSAQDVLPPSVNPESKIAYSWKGDWRNIPNVPANLLDLWLSFGNPEKYEYKPEKPLITVSKQTLLDLKSALSFIPSDDRVEWVRLGHALKPLGDDGRKIWLEWSIKYKKFEQAHADRAWASFRTRVIDYRAIFVASMKQGWRATPAIKSNLKQIPIGSRPVSAFLPSNEILMIAASDVVLEPIHWIWDGWLAKKKLHVLAGAPNCGKTTLALSMAAVLSKGGVWPDGTTAEVGKIVMWSGEDGIADTLAPRLNVMHGNGDNVFFIKGAKIEGDPKPRQFDPALDMDGLKNSLQAIGNVALLIIDPVVSVIAGDGHRNNEVRRGLQPLVDLADSVGCAVLGITHFSKGTKGGDVLERLNGSLAFGALSRIVMAAAKREEPDESQMSHLFVRVKSNIGPSVGGFQYGLQVSPTPRNITIPASGIVWGAGLDGTARALLGEAELDDSEATDENKIGQAIEFLLSALQYGARSEKEIKEEAEKLKIVERTLRRSKKILGVTSYKNGRLGWFWKLPVKP